MRKISSFILFLALIATGCTQATITDETTTQKPPVLVGPLADYLITVQVYTDAMQRDGEFPQEVIVDTRFDQSTPIMVSPKEKELKRGDLVYLEIPNEVAAELSTGNAGPTVTRIIGLPGEVLEIQKGQVYINGSRLDTFYGHEYKWAGGTTSEKRTDFSKQAITIPEDSYFLIGDNWWRSPVHGPVPKQYIKGKVVGSVQRLSETYQLVVITNPPIETSEVLDWIYDTGKVSKVIYLTANEEVNRILDLKTDPTFILTNTKGPIDFRTMNVVFRTTDMNELRKYLEN